MTGRAVTLMFGTYSVSMEKKQFDYKPYLGPDWKPSYENPGSTVCNHQSWTDIVVIMQRQMPAHVAKAAVAKIPLVGGVAQAVGCMFFDRGAKGNRKDLITQIAER